MTEQLNKNNCNSYDLLKIISAFLVIGIHTKPFDGMGFVEFGFGFVSRFAVPIFFLLSGYFLFRENTTVEKVLKYCFRIIVMYVIWCVIYIAIGIGNASSFTEIIFGGGVLLFVVLTSIGCFCHYNKCT